MREILSRLRYLRPQAVQVSVRRDGVRHRHSATRRLREDAGAGRQPFAFRTAARGVDDQSRDLRRGLQEDRRRAEDRARSAQLHGEERAAADGDHFGRRDHERDLRVHLRSDRVQHGRQ